MAADKNRLISITPLLTTSTRTHINVKQLFLAGPDEILVWSRMAFIVFEFEWPFKTWRNFEIFFWPATDSFFSTEFLGGQINFSTFFVFVLLFRNQVFVYFLWCDEKLKVHILLFFILCHKKIFFGKNVFERNILHFWKVKIFLFFVTWLKKIGTW